MHTDDSAHCQAKHSHITSYSPLALFPVEIVQFNTRSRLILINKLPLHAPQLPQPEAIALIRYLPAQDLQLCYHYSCVIIVMVFLLSAP